jgi:hypothetical protein
MENNQDLFKWANEQIKLMNELKLNKGEIKLFIKTMEKMIGSNKEYEKKFAINKIGEAYAYLQYKKIFKE